MSSHNNSDTLVVDTSDDLGNESIILIDENGKEEEPVLKVLEDGLTTFSWTVMDPVTNEFINVGRISPLIYYVSKGDKKMCEQLLGSGNENPSNEVNFQTEFGWTALMEAYASSQFFLVPFLIEKGADEAIETKFDRRVAKDFCKPEDYFGTYEFVKSKDQVAYGPGADEIIEALEKLLSKIKESSKQEEKSTLAMGLGKVFLKILSGNPISAAVDAVFSKNSAQSIGKRLHSINEIQTLIPQLQELLDQAAKRKSELNQMNQNSIEYFEETQIESQGDALIQQYRQEIIELFEKGVSHQTISKILNTNLEVIEFIQAQYDSGKF